MDLKLFLAVVVIFVAGYLGFAYGQKVEAAAWKKVLEAKGFAAAEWERLRKAL